MNLHKTPPTGQLLAVGWSVLLAILHYVRAAIRGDFVFGKKAPPCRRLALSEKTPLDEHCGMMSDLWQRNAERRRGILARRSSELEEELDYLRLFFVQPVCNATPIFKLLLQIYYSRFRLSKALSRLDKTLVSLDKTLLRESSASIRLDDTLFRIGQLVSDEREMLLQHGGGTVLRNILLNISEGIEVHGSKISSANVKAHPPLGARANVERGVEVVITENHVNRAAPSGWMERLVRYMDLWWRKYIATTHIGIITGKE